MLTKITEGVLVHESGFLQSNCVVVQGRSGVLLIDPGITVPEMVGLAHDLRELGQSVVAGFSTHPDWDHVLWHPELGDAPRYGTARASATIQEFLSQEDWTDQLADYLPPEISDEIPMDLLGQISGLAAGATEIPWDGPVVRILEHQGHAAGHAALFIEEGNVLVAGDMLSDILIPFFDSGTADPIADYLAGLDVLEGVVDGAAFVIPGHGSVGGAGQARARLDLDRAYAVALRDGRVPDDPRVGPTAPPDMEWLADVHQSQAEHLLAQRAGLQG